MNSKTSTKKKKSRQNNPKRKNPAQQIKKT